MENIIEGLFRVYSESEIQPHYISKSNKNIHENELLLKKYLSKNQKKLLLRIIDEKDLIIENTAVAYFSDGFKLGLKLGIELLDEK